MESVFHVDLYTVLLCIIAHPLNNSWGPMNTGHPIKEALQSSGCNDINSIRVFVFSVLLVQHVCIRSSNVC